MNKSKKPAIRTMIAGVAIAAALVGGAVMAAPASASELYLGAMPAGRTMHAGDLLASPGVMQYTVTMQSDGNLVEHGNGHVMWASGTSGNPGAHFTMQFDGNAVVYSATGKALWSTRTSTDATVSGEVGVGADGNFWVKRYKAVVWQNNAPRSNYLAGKGAGLFADEYLHAGNAKLIDQLDGNLVSYVNGKAVWSSRTNGLKALARLTPAGALEVYTTTNTGDLKTVWTTPAAGANAKLQLGTHGRLTLFSGTRIVWQS